MCVAYLAKVDELGYVYVVVVWKQTECSRVVQRSQSKLVPIARNKPIYPTVYSLHSPRANSAPLYRAKITSAPPAPDNGAT